MKVSSSSSNGSLTNVGGSKDDEFSFTDTHQPKQLVDKETKEVEATNAIKAHYQTMDDNLSQDILQQEKAYSKEQECALNNVINKHTDEIVQHTAEEVWKE